MSDESMEANSETAINKTIKLAKKAIVSIVAAIAFCFFSLLIMFNNNLYTIQDVLGIKINDCQKMMHWMKAKKFRDYQSDTFRPAEWIFNYQHETTSWAYSQCHDEIQQDHMNYCEYVWGIKLRDEKIPNESSPGRWSATVATCASHWVERMKNDASFSRPFETKRGNQTLIKIDNVWANIQSIKLHDITENSILDAIKTHKLCISSGGSSPKECRFYTLEKSDQAIAEHERILNMMIK